MPEHPERYWSIAERLSYEFGSTSRHMRKYRVAYGIGACIFVLVVSVVTWVRKDASVADLPIIFLASGIHLLRGMAIVSLLFAWLGSQFVGEWLYTRTSDEWVRKEALRRPGVSFQVPHWRFYLPAALARFAILGAWVGGIFFLLYVIPNRVLDLERFTPDGFPF